MPVIQKVRVDLAERSYDVTIGVRILDQVGAIIAALPEEPARAVVITDSNVRPLYAPDLLDSLSAAGVASDVIEFPAGEQHKNLASYGAVMDRLLALDPPIDRRTLIVSLGGGVVGDLAGFVAATALRGLWFVNVSTTLLADVDAAVGGKTGLDSPAGKNLIGAFHQPRAVIMDAAALKTLPRHELQNGLAECVKHAIIADSEMLGFIETNAERILTAVPEVLGRLIIRNVAIKADIVAADELETGKRAHLNFGHTVGHAIETVGGYGVISHGQAVSLGMVAACRLAVARRLMDVSHDQRVRKVLGALGLPVRLTDVPKLPREAGDLARLLAVMRRDKKAQAGAIRFVLPTGIGNVTVYDDIPAEQIEQAIAILRV